MILITGAAGKTGRAVVKALAGRGEPVRAFVRRDEPIGDADLIVGDMQDAADFRRAAAGVRAIYHIPPNMQPAEVEIGQNAIAAAQAAGVERFIYHSVLHPQIEAMPHHWNKLRVEELLFASGLDVTIMQPTVYMQNVWGSLDGDAYRVPYPVETPLSYVDLRDVAEVAAIVLTTAGHQHATYELCGTGPLTQADIAALLTAGLGRPVTAQAQSPANWRETAQQAGIMSQYAIDTLSAMFEHYAVHGMTGNSNVLRWLLGREPTGFAAFLRREWSV